MPSLVLIVAMARPPLYGAVIPGHAPPELGSTRVRLVLVSKPATADLDGVDPESGCCRSRFRVRRFASPRNDENLRRADQANVGMGRNRLAAPMITMTKNASTMPWITANGGSVCVGASAFRASTLRNPWITRTNTFRYNEVIAVTT